MYNALKNARRLNKVSAEELTELINLQSISSYYKKERGEVPTTIDEAKVLARRLGKTIDELFIEEK
jgi:transcriptional regulator with XRE-family HTH domain